MQVNLVCVDETHIFKHAEDTLQTHTSGEVRASFSLFLPPNLFPFALFPSASAPHHVRGVVRQGARGVCELSEAGVDLFDRFDPRH